MQCLEVSGAVRPL